MHVFLRKRQPLQKTSKIPALATTRIATAATAAKTIKTTSATSVSGLNWKDKLSVRRSLEVSQARSSIPRSKFWQLYSTNFMSLSLTRPQTHTHTHAHTHIHFYTRTHLIFLSYLTYYPSKSAVLNPRYNIQKKCCNFFSLK